MSEYEFLTLALHCRGLIDPLLELEEQKLSPLKHPSKPWTEVALIDDKGQYLMFPIPMDKRAEYGKFAQTLAYYYLPDNSVIYSHLEFVNYLFHGFFARFTDQLPEMIELLSRLAGGEQLEDYRPLITFLSNLESSSLHEHQNQRGGCF